jgi:hypothetical protein
MCHPDYDVQCTPDFGVVYTSRHQPMQIILQSLGGSQERWP